jgi:LacI family transcriptional regulator
MSAGTAGRRSTLVRVAEHAGVSIASASRVVNGLPASAELAARVRKAADELGYVPDATARSLKVGRTNQIALAVADVGNPVYVAMMHEVNRVITKAGYRLVLSSTGNDAQSQLDFLGELDRGFVDGLILSPLRMTAEVVERLRATRHPVVVIGTLPEDVAIDSVRADSPRGIALAVDHLATQGRRRIALLNGPVDTVPGAARLAGYLSAMDQQGFVANADAQIAAKDFTYRAGITATARLLERSSPDAIVCANDLLAIGALKTIRAAGMRVPDDIALVGMDDSDIAELPDPSLTSVNLGSVKRAKAAAKLLLRRLADHDAAAKRLVIEPTLTVRESSVSTRRRTAASNAEEMGPAAAPTTGGQQAADPAGDGEATTR